MDSLETHDWRLWNASRIPSRFAMSTRDRRIIERALKKVGGVPRDFAESLRALRESVEEEIPGGRIFVLGSTEHGPILGSIISGLGVVDSPAGIQLVRARPGDLPSTIGSLFR